VQRPAHRAADEEPAGCNGIDDDCDGIIDDGLTCTGCGSEICNGIDDDCNDVADDGDLPGVGEPCGLTEGACEPGHFECRSGGLVCVGDTGPATEICDGVDNNCDGAIDGLIRACYEFPTGCVADGASFDCTGRCRAGTQTCTAATQPNYGACSGQLARRRRSATGRTTTATATPTSSSTTWACPACAASASACRAARWCAAPTAARRSATRRW
jgi:hypothetical protein